MSVDSLTPSASKEDSSAEVPACSTGRALGIKCAVVSWVAPLAAIVLLVISMHVPVLSVFNILFVGFGVMAMIRSINHIRRFGACGLGGHIVIGGLFNAIILALVFIYVYTGFDPLSIRVTP